MKKWTVGRPDPGAAKSLSELCGLPPICAEILVSRGIDAPEKALDLFGGDEELSDPLLVKDMREAADTLLAAVDEGRKICVYGDYDCDGITAGTMLYSYLECMGADVTLHINTREEGYGLCADVIRRLSADGVQLIVTVDNGISALPEAALAKELGMELVITDHHRPGEKLPEAAAVVDPHRADDLSPFKDLCGCGVALKLIAAMDGGCASAVEQFSDLAAIATVADVVPLRGENRLIVQKGLRYLENTENAGLKALMDVSGVKPPINAYRIAFGIAPRINAAGRFATAMEAAELLLCEEPEEAERAAQRLNSLNSERKKTEEQISDEIHEKLRHNKKALCGRVLFLYGEGWHHGVIGIVAARLVERFGKPVFILSDDGEYARGSARSVEGFSVHRALTACGELLTKFGGHEGAGGFSLCKENIDKFDKALQEYAAKEYPEMPMRTIHADKLLRPEELTADAVQSLSIFEPCGEGNPKPLFLLTGARLLDLQALSGGAHTKLRLGYGDKVVYGLMFGTRTAEFPYRPGDVLDMLAYPEVSTYGGRTEVDLRVTDCRKSGMPQNKYFAAKAAYERYKRGEGTEPALAPRIVPSRQELAAVYRAVPESGADFDTVYGLVCSDELNYCKFRLSLDIFEELGLMETDLYLETAKRLPAEKKVNLDDSRLLTELKGLTLAGTGA